MSSNFNEAYSQTKHLWAEYAKALIKYMEKSGKLSNTVESHEELYLTWIRTGELWKSYTNSLREFGRVTTWDASVPVTYAEPVGFSTPDNDLIYVNAFPGDENNPLCSSGHHQRYSMRVGGLPEGVRIFTSLGHHVIVNGKPVPLVIRPTVQAEQLDDILLLG